MSYIAGTPYVGMDVRMKPGIGGNRGFVTGWNPVTGRPVWRIAGAFPGVERDAGRQRATWCSTARWKVGSRRSMRARGAAVEVQDDSGIIGQPVAYRGPDGKEYIAVLSGVGGWSGAIVAGGLDPRDSSAALGFVNAMRDLPTVDNEGRNALCVLASLTARLRGGGRCSPRGTRRMFAGEARRSRLPARAFGGRGIGEGRALRQRSVATGAVRGECVRAQSRGSGSTRRSTAWAVTRTAAAGWVHR